MSLFARTWACPHQAKRADASSGTLHTSSEKQQANQAAQLPAETPPSYAKALGAAEPAAAEPAAAEPAAALKMRGTAGATDSVALLGEPAAASPPPAAKKPSSKPKKKEKANRALKRAASIDAWGAGDASSSILLQQARKSNQGHGASHAA